MKTCQLALVVSILSAEVSAEPDPSFRIKFEDLPLASAWKIVSDYCEEKHTNYILTNESRRFSLALDKTSCTEIAALIRILDSTNTRSKKHGKPRQSP